MTYEEAIRLWGEQRLRTEGIAFDEVTSAYVEYFYDHGCPTCGGTVSFDVTVFYRPPGLPIQATRPCKSFNVDLTDLLTELFKVSEPR